MKHSHKHDGSGPTPAELAAYADGELVGPVRAAVEAWLAEHPETAAEVEAQQRVARPRRRRRRPEPAEAEWAVVLARI